MIQKLWDRWWARTICRMRCPWWSKCKALVEQVPEVWAQELLEWVACHQLMEQALRAAGTGVRGRVQPGVGAGGQNFPNFLRAQTWQLETSSNSQTHSPAWEEWATIQWWEEAVVVCPVSLQHRWHKCRLWWVAHQEVNQTCQQLILGHLVKNIPSNCNKSKKWVSMTRTPSYKSWSKLEEMCS